MSGNPALAAWAADSATADAAKITAQARDADGPMIDRALEIVRQFIIDRRLILFGGLAIDYALRLRGSHIYPDGERPDFDFLSSRSVDDAYDLADILIAAGFKNVGAIRAIHVQTMRVRTDFISVADIGYAPPAVFERIPTVDWRGMRVVHPDFQRMDQHLAFCFPFNGPPLEDVNHRWRKDLKRFNLFERHWPITAEPATMPTSLTRRTGTVHDRAGVALHGFAAYAVLRSTLDELAAAFGRPPPAVEAPRLNIDLTVSGDTIKVDVEMPLAAAVYFAALNPEAALPGGRRYHPYMDICPETFRDGNTVVLSVRKRRLAATVVRGEKIRIVTPHYLLLHFLFEAFRAEDESARNVYRLYYLATLEILRTAEGLFHDAAQAAGELVGDAASGPARLTGQIAALFAHSPFAPTVDTMGSINQDAAYVIKMAAAAEKVKDTPPPALGLDPDLAAQLGGLPRNYYGRGDRPAFDYAASPLFRRDGTAC